MLLQRNHNNVDYTGNRAQTGVPGCNATRIGGGGVNWGCTINKGHILNGLAHSFTIRVHI